MLGEVRCGQRVEPVVADRDELPSRLRGRVGLRFGGHRPRASSAPSPASGSATSSIASCRQPSVESRRRVPTVTSQAIDRSIATQRIYNVTQSDDTHPGRGHAGAAAADRDPRVSPSRPSARRGAAADGAVGSLRHRRPPLARPAGGRAVSDHSRARVGRRARIDSRAARRARRVARSAKAIAPCSSTCTGRAGGAARAPCTARRRAARPGASTASPIRRARGCSAAGRRHIYLEPGVGIARLPDAVSVDDYIGGGCGLLTAVHIRERAALRPGDSVLVQGVGAVGLERHRARAAGGRLDHLRRSATRRRGSTLARADGRRPRLRRSASTTAEERLQAVRDRTHGEGVDVVIEAAGSARAIEEGVTLVRDGGRYVIAGHYTDVGPSTINAHQHINRKHLEIRGCWGSEPGTSSGARDPRSATATCRGATSARGRIRSRRSTRRSPTPRPCGSRRRWSIRGRDGRSAFSVTRDRPAELEPATRPNAER